MVISVTNKMKHKELKSLLLVYIHVHTVFREVSQVQ